MARVYISIGSNIDRERYITAALDALAGWFDEPLISSVYESESVGFDGSPFYNLVVGVDTDLSVAELSARFKQLEADNGRRRDVPKFSPRTLDLDILTYDHEVGRVDGVELPRGEILKNAFVLLPLAAQYLLLQTASQNGTLLLKLLLVQMQLGETVFFNIQS